MERHVLVLADGRELTSGTGLEWAIQSVKRTQSVNTGTELTPGGVCAGVLEVKILDTAGTLALRAGEEVTLFTLGADDTRTQVGIYTIENPTRPSVNLWSVTAYDRVSWLDRDLSDWLYSLAGWPYTLRDFAHMVCEACGLTLEGEDLLNGDYQIPVFSGRGITGRQLMRWVCQAGGRFCRANPRGNLEFAWYRPVTDRCIGPAADVFYGAEYTHEDQGSLRIWSTGMTVTEEEPGCVAVMSDAIAAEDDGLGNVTIHLAGGITQHFYYQNGLRREDYRTAAIEKVQIKGTEADVGAVYPDITGEKNTLTISGNYLLRSSDPAALEQVARNLYGLFAPVTYTPMKVTVPASSGFAAGDILTVTDSRGEKMTLYVMTCAKSGGRLTLTATGSPRRDSSSAVNQVSMQALSGKVMELRLDVEGLRAENRDARNNYAALQLDVEGISAEVVQNQTELTGLQQQMTTLNQTAQGLTIQVQTMVDDGVSRVTTRQKNYTFDDQGLQISGSRGMKNLLDETGMTVSRSGEVMLQANDAGVTAADVKVHNYLIVGKYARFEDYADGSGSRRTACFFTEGA